MRIFDITTFIARLGEIMTLMLAGVLVAGVFALPAQAAGPIKIGVIAPASAINGVAIFQGAKLAAEEINANGGVNGRKIQLVEYDSHASSSDAVRAIQRAARKDKVVAVTGVFITEVALGLEPWSSRLHMPLIITGAASTKITENVHANYAKYKYIFNDWLNSYQIGEHICDSAKDILVGQLHYKTAAIMSEDAAWTKPLNKALQKCLPEAGLKITDTVVFSPSTKNFTPIFSKIESSNPDVIIAGISHVGIKPTVQWHNQRVPILMAGVSSQAGTSNFWKDTNGATQGVITESAGAPGAALTPKSIPFEKAYQKKFNSWPAYDAFSTYDSIYFLKAAIERAESTDPDKLVDALEKTNYVGTWGTIKFQGKEDTYTHGLVYGKGGVTALDFQWQDGKQVAIWPKSAATGKVMVPDYIKAARK